MPGIPLPHFLLLKLSFNMPLKLELHHHHYSESEWETIPPRGEGEERGVEGGKVLIWQPLLAVVLLALPFSALLLLPFHRLLSRRTVYQGFELVALI